MQIPFMHIEVIFVQCIAALLWQKKYKLRVAMENARSGTAEVIALTSTDTRRIGY